MGGTAAGTLTREQLDAELKKGMESFKTRKAYTADEVALKRFDLREIIGHGMEALRHFANLGQPLVRGDAYGEISFSMMKKAARIVMKMIRVK